MPIWTQTYLDQLASDAEEDIAKKIDCLFARTALSIVNGTALYDLPAKYKNIYQVSWKGKRLEPLTRHILSLVDHDYLNNKSTPEFYSAEADGTGKIRFYPIPNVTIASVTTNLYGSAIPDRVIVSYFYVPDTANTVLSIPRWISRRLIKSYVLHKAFKIEGKGQNIEMSDYWHNKYLLGLEALKLATTNTNLIGHRRSPGHVFQTGFKPAKPVWPAKFGADRF